ncbi:PH domain-containing protein [Psychroflexus gondwanensis]|jgi:putative membrane protein|uniref:PH domain-containing protein n=1 Tax=Psychroflexus gondwanensis TaxID=251 RepID=UPI0011BE732F|nr:PH domain-containing protein [Psychroflexus gondwanensis]TXE17927.1 PH domain-containing protein [Psychroflexus gondwanensis]
MSNIDFSIPRLQSFNGIFLIFFTDLIKRVRQNIFILAIPFFKKNLLQDYGTYIIIGLILLVVLQFVFSYLSYRKFKFSIQEDAFHLDQGVIKLSHVEIPFERIQNINLQQNLLQRFLNVVGFEIETAGEGTAEIKIKALDKDFAQSLKDKLIKEKERRDEDELQILDDESASDSKLDEPSKRNEEPSLLFKLSFNTLLKVGISSNLFKGVGLLLAFLAYAYNFVRDFLTQIYDLNLEEDFKNRIPETLTFISILIFGVIFIGFFITVMTTVLKYYNLKITKNQENFEVEYGLFKRINKVIKKVKTQIFEIRTNPIKKLFKIKSIYVSQAASNQLSEKQKIGIVGVSKLNLDLLFRSLFNVDLSEQVYSVCKSQARLFFRYFYQRLAIIVILSLMAYAFYFNWVSGVGIFLLLLIFIFLSILKVKKSSIGINSTFINVRSGSIETIHKLIEIHKLQSVKLSRNIFQQYNGHADLILETASGSLNVEYLKVEEARKILNYLIYKVESTNKDWI